MRTRSRSAVAFGIAQKIRAAPYDQRAFVAVPATPRGQTFLDETGGGRVELAAGAGQFGGDLGLGLCQGPSAQPSIEKVGGFLERGRRYSCSAPHQPIFHLTVLKDHDRQGLVGGQRHELHMFDPRVPDGRRPRGPAPPARPERIALASLSASSKERPWADSRASIVLAIVLADITDLQQPVDEEAQARMRRQPPGADMRRVRAGRDR